MREATRKAIHAIRRASLRERLAIEVLSNQLYPGRNPSRVRGADGYVRAGMSPYNPGDNWKSINWSASASTGLQQMVKDERFEPRRATIYAIVCVDPSMDFSPEPEPSADFAAQRATMRTTAAYLLAAIMLAAGDRFDFALSLFSTARRGPVLKPQPAGSMFDPALSAVLEEQAQDGIAGGGGLAEALRLLPVEPSLVFVLGDFVELLAEDQGTQADVRALALAGRRHGLRLLQLYDPVVEQLASLSGVFSFTDMTSQEAVEPILSIAGLRQYRQHLADCQRRLERLLHEGYSRSEIFRTDGGIGSWKEKLRPLLRA
jgi:uncharacterized protein (DUF58 family)